MRMATHPLWNDDYWLLVLQLYLKRPTGVKAVYAREAVDLAVELHLPPPFIHQQLQEMDRRDRLVLQLVWKLTPRSRVGLQRYCAAAEDEGVRL